VAPGAPIAGRHLLIVDDVMTTGATATAASQCLLAAGAASVSVLVLARTGRPGAHSDDNRAAPATP
jgi:predicted amidophosphoribosyltransferase